MIRAHNAESALSEVPSIREDAERMVRNLNGSDRYLSANMTLVLLDETERLRDENEKLRKAAEAGLRDLLRFAPAHWRNQTDGEILLRNAVRRAT